MCHGSACDLPFCSYRSSGSALGRKKKNPSVRGRDDRETQYMKDHPWCERCKRNPSTQCHHKERRGLGGHNRTKSPLEALCDACHQGPTGEHK